MIVNKGVFKIKCVKVGGHTLTGYGQYAFAENEEIDLLSDTAPGTIRCASLGIAKNICSNLHLELAQLILAGYFQIIETQEPVMIIGAR